MSEAEPRKSLRDNVGGESTGRFPWGTIRWLINSELQGSAELTVGVVEIEPGAKNQRHRHPNCDEALYVIDGELEHSLGDESIRLGPGVALLIPRDVPHNATNCGSSVAKLLVCYSTGDRETVPC